MGLRSDDWWELTGRELQALRSVHEDSLRRWAIERAMYANVNFRESDKEGRYVDAPFEADDFLGFGDRPKRTAQMKRDKMAVIAANSRLAKIKSGEPPSSTVPSWALGETKRAN